MKAVIYARVAIPGRAQPRLSEQIEACRRYAEAHGLVVVAVFSEVASGSGLDRPQLSQLRRFVASEKVEVALVVDLNRLSRKPSELLILYREFDQMGASIRFLRRQQDNPSERQTG